MDVIEELSVISLWDLTRVQSTSFWSILGIFLLHSQCFCERLVLVVIHFLVRILWPNRWIGDYYQYKHKATEIILVNLKWPNPYLFTIESNSSSSSGFPNNWAPFSHHIDHKTICFALLEWIVRLRYSTTHTHTHHTNPGCWFIHKPDRVMLIILQSSAHEVQNESLERLGESVHQPDGSGLLCVCVRVFFFYYDVTLKACGHHRTIAKLVVRLTPHRDRSNKLDVHWLERTSIYSSTHTKAGNTFFYCCLPAPNNIHLYTIIMIHRTATMCVRTP